ncbi:MAG: hypothetical protein JST21_05505 [Bacteroidetes bacterium]|nr:hypothetical protein [Bacteroidota bacterium]
MVILKVFYYYYHLFYQNIFGDSDSYFTAKLALTASESLLVISLLDIGSAYFFCYSLNKYYMAAITLILLAINSIFIFNSKNTVDIEKSKPKFFNNHNLTIILSWLFFLVTTSSMFWLGDVVQIIIDNCQK